MGAVITQSVQLDSPIVSVGILLILALVGAVFVLALKLVKSKNIKSSAGASESRLKVLFNEAADAIYVSELDGRLVRVNARACQATEYTEQELLGMYVFDIDASHSTTAEQFTAFSNSLTPGQSLAIESLHRRKDGTTFPVEITIARVQTPESDEIIGFAREISERRYLKQQREQAEIELRTQERFVSAIADTSPALVYVYDMVEQVNVYSNAGIERLLGYTPKEIQEMGDELFVRLIHPEDMSGVIAFQSKMMVARDEDVLEIEYRMKRRDGQWCTFHSYERPFLRNKDGSLKQKVGVAIDVTEQKQAERALVSAKEYAESLIDTANVIVVGLDNDGNINVFNQTAEEITGYTRAKLKNRNWFEVLVPRDRYPYVWEEFERLMSGGVPKKFENPILTESGEERYIVWQNSEVREFGKVTGTISFGLDITDRRLMEETLRDSQRRYQGFIQGALEGIWCNRIDPPMPTDISIEEQVNWIFDHMIFVECNDVFARMYGYENADEVVGLTLVQLMGGDQRAAEEVVRLLINNGYTFNVTESLEVTKTGESVWFLNSAVSFYEDGKVSEIWGTQLDITDRKRHEVEREQLINELEDKNQEMERLIYTISHDMKTPLVTIGGYLGMLKRVAISGDIQQIEQDVARIEGATGRMKELLDDLLQLSRIGRTDRPAEDVALSELAEQAIELAGGHLPAGGVEFVVGDSLPVLRGDRSRLLELVQNLVENAIKYMGDQPHPRIEIGAKHNGQKTVCYVKDNGMGIDPQYQDKVFRLFEQLNPGESEGTGVGLAIVKRIVETNNGKIWFESDGLGKGTTFYFELPVVG